MIKALLLLGGACLIATPASAETLGDAVRAAYASNPTLAAAAARQDGLAQTVDQARAGGRLALGADVSAGYDRFDYGKGGGAAVSADLPIWTGGRVRNAVLAAQGDVSAGEQALRDTRAAVLESVVTVFADLLYDQQAVKIVEADIALLDNQVAEADARFALGSSTRTDVARLEAQVASARATRADAMANLAIDSASYLATVGHAPGVLADPVETLEGLPTTLDQAHARTLIGNPLYQQARIAARGAAARIDVARSNGAPSVSLGGNYGYAARLGSGGSYNRAATGGLTIHVPILTGGLVGAQVRQSRADFRAAQFDAEAAGREATRATDAAWALSISRQAQAAANAESVAAAETALKGVRAEYAFALRSTLDILVADESLRGAELALARNRSDLLIAQALLLRATGRLDGRAFAMAPSPRDE